MTTTLITLGVFVAVSALIGALAFILRDRTDGRVEDRLEVLAGVKKQAPAQSVLKQSMLAQINAAPSFFESLVERLGGLAALFEQADTTLTPPRFFALSGLLFVGGGVAAALSGVTWALAPVTACLFGSLPLLWLVLRRRKRLRQFATQLPGALELISRALRAGHSLASGMNLVAEEMQPPIQQEFLRVYESQNLGIPMDESLRAMTRRVPNLDLKFFVTAVILQRQTGGDLAEILDKIGHLIRERFKIWGQVQALTGEGRLSGIVLLALPPLLFLAVYYLNPDYCMVLFRDPLGKKMLAAAVFLQLIGALVIKKIINIKV